jgi:hypothetical protein
VANLVAPDVEATRRLFEAATRNLLAAEQRAGVRKGDVAVVLPILIQFRAGHSR